MQLRERYQVYGPEPFHDHELLALVLGTGCTGRTASQVARELLESTGGLAAIPCSAPAVLSRVTGMGPVRAIRVHAACSLAERLLLQKELPIAMDSPLRAADFLRPRMANRRYEEFHGLFLDTKKHLLAHRMLTRGNNVNTIVDQRQVFREALELGANSVIVAHNHPSGDPSPSSEDIMVTDRLSRAGKLLGIPLIDHLVLAGSKHYSFLEAGLMTNVAGGFGGSSRFTI